jgi:ubiquinone/menaquinone biosynthesis C-methylase UbiE
MTINSETNRPDRWRSPEFANSWFATNQTRLTEQSIRKRLVSALPFQPGAIIRVLDVGTGDGALGLEVLSAYPKAQLVCHDYSEAMLVHARQQLAKLSPSVSFVTSDLKDPEWTHVIEGSFDAVVSSIAIHNVAEQSDSGSDRIRAIYAEIFSLLKEGGCFFNFEFVSPPGPVTEGIYLKKLIDDYQSRPKVERRTERNSEEFKTATLRHLRHVHTPLLDQLNWLRQAQFDEVDCFWKDMQTAIIVGFRH